ncbi:MAG TPA: FecR domain-containing protein [Gemmatimonadaceae bacterium]
MPSPDAPTESTPPATPATPSSAYLRDETALRRAFDAEFAGAMAIAREKLKDAPALAPRVVETAFVNVWQQRDTLTSVQQFKKVLSDEINHGCARALSRRISAQRFGGSASRDEQTMTGTHPASPNADVEEAWSRITRTIRGEGNTAAAHKAAASAGRHDAASHMKDMSKGGSWTAPIIIGVLAVAIAVWGVRKLSNLGEDDAVLASVASPNLQPIASGAGQTGNVKLGDGSPVRIGPDTKVFIPDGFPTKIRAIRVEGSAAFEVAPNQVLPFRVVANHTQFIATGTKFAISSYPEDSSAAVFVQGGSVTIKLAKQTSVVAAGQAMVADKSGIHALSDDAKAESFSWLDNKMIIHQKPLRHVVAVLGRFFNSDVKVPDAPLLDRPTSIDSPLDSAMLAIKQIEQSANVKFGYEGQNKVLRDAGPKSAAKPAAKLTRKR